MSGAKQEALFPLKAATASSAEMGGYIEQLMADEIDILLCELDDISREEIASGLDPDQVVNCYESEYGVESDVPKSAMQELAARALHYRASNHISYMGYTQNGAEAMK